MIKDYESTEKNYGAAGTKCPRKEKKKKKTTSNSCLFQI